MRLSTKLIIGITLFIILICAGYSATIFSTSSDYKYSTQIGFASKEDLAVDKVWNYNSFSALYNQSNFMKATTGVENVFENVPIEFISSQNIDVKFDKNDKNQIC